MSHAILLEIEGLDSKTEAGLFAHKIEEFAKNLHNQGKTDAFIIDHQVKEFDPCIGGVVIYQP